MLFNRDPSNVVQTKVVSKADSDKEDILLIKNVPIGEHDFGFKLYWGCNQKYTFPKKFKISVLGNLQIFLLNYYLLSLLSFSQYFL